MVIDWIWVIISVVSGVMVFLMGAVAGQVYMLHRIAKENKARMLEAQQQQMWEDYLNALKEGSYGR